MLSIEAAFNKLQAVLLTGAPARVEDMEFRRRILQATANVTFIRAFDALCAEINRIMQSGADISRSTAA